MSKGLEVNQWACRGRFHGWHSGFPWPLEGGLAGSGGQVQVTSFASCAGWGAVGAVGWAEVTWGLPTQFIPQVETRSGGHHLPPAVKVPRGRE